MRLDVLLTELMDKPTEWDWGYWVPGATPRIQPQPSPKGFARNTYSASFSVETSDGQTLLYEMEFEKVLQRWKVDFALVQGNQKVRKLQQFSDSRVGARVISTVMTILDEFLNQTQRPEFMFYAMRSEPSRVKLYDALSKRVASKHGYKLERTEDDTAVSYFLNHHGEALQESFDNPYNWRWVTRSSHMYWAEFDAAGTKVSVEFDATAPGVFEVVFVSHDEERNRASVKAQNWGDQTKAQRILATVVEVMHTFTQTTRDVTELRFISVEASRSKLYQRMVQRVLATKMPDWTMRVRSGSVGTLFVLAKQENA